MEVQFQTEERKTGGMRKEKERKSEREEGEERTDQTSDQSTLLLIWLATPNQPISFFQTEELSLSLGSAAATVLVGTASQLLNNTAAVHFSLCFIRSNCLQNTITSE